MNTPQEQVQAPPDLREMISIAVGLTVVCLVAAVILALFYYLTEPAKARNIQAREQRMIQGLLALAPSARVNEIRRYLMWRDGKLEIYYLTPKVLARVDAEGRELATYEVPPEVAESESTNAKDDWVREQANPGESDELRYVGRFFLASQGGKTVGYVVEGVTPGYKTWIRYFLAIDSRFGVQGLEVIEHEEDPGLGAEITQRYFKNQFAGRSAEQIANISVTKDPLPADWRAVLEELGDIDFHAWVNRHRAAIDAHPQIHAITGSTISSEAVTKGVKRTLRNFRKRMRIVEAYL
ncbi:MAG: hypothetical protein Kow006_33070 [Gammaproteobacteria bacterium]